MRKKIVGIFVCMLLIATAVPAVISEKNSKKNSTVPNLSLINMAGNWTETQKLYASDGTAGKVFGGSISIDGDTVLIGAVLGDGNAVTSGCAYVFTRSGTTWTQQAKLIASDGATGDQFGCWVSLSGDTALIGAPYDDAKGVFSGSAYVFTRSGTTWIQQAKLLPSDNTAGDWFGYCVSLDDDTALIGAQGDQNLVDTGTAYVFTRSGTTWTLEQKLFASDGAAGDCFGFTVFLENNTALIGADYDDDKGLNSGSAYVFTRSGTTWTQQAKLLAADGAKEDDFSGGGVYLYGDTALISAELDDDKGINSGSAYVFTRSGTIWTQQAKLIASDGAEKDQFSMNAVALEGDTALIGAWYDNGEGLNSGSAYIFTRNGTTWTQQQKIIASDSAADDQFGVAVAIEGNTTFIGAWYDDDKGKDSGSVYVFIKTDNQPPSAPTITSPNSGKAGDPIDYKFNAVDPNSDQVKYIIDWGDNTTETTVLNPSGLDVTVTHTWSKKGDYIIKAHAQDAKGLDGPESTKTITMPKNKVKTIDAFFLRFLENYPILYQLLQRLQGI